MLFPDESLGDQQMRLLAAHGEIVSDCEARAGVKMLDEKRSMCWSWRSRSITSGTRMVPEGLRLFV
jgi:hypothetical protein